MDASVTPSSEFTSSEIQPVILYLKTLKESENLVVLPGLKMFEIKREREAKR